MLGYTVVPSGARHLVVYPTPGCSVPTVVCVCSSASHAQTEAKRLNVEQARREEELQRDRALRGFHRIHPDLRMA